MHHALNDRLKHYAKALLGSLCVYRLSMKPIIVLSTRRSGTTLLLRMLYSQSGTDFVDQPFDLWRYHPHADQIPIPPYRQYVNLNSEEKDCFFAYYQKLIEGSHRLRNQWNVFDAYYSLIVDRLIIKELNAKILTDEFAQHADCECIYLIRHPIPTALSILKRSWGHTAWAFLEDEWFSYQFLDKETDGFCRDVLNHGSLLEIYVLEWCLDNLYPLGVARQRDWVPLTYEELVLRPYSVSSMLCNRFDFPDPDRMAEAVAQPSKTSVDSSKTAIKRVGPASMVERWQDQISESLKVKINDILDLFEISTYSAFDAYPVDDFCHFGALSDDASVT